MLIGYLTPKGIMLDKEGRYLLDTHTDCQIQLLSENGDLILSKGERILHYDPDQNINIRDKWSETNFYCVFDGNLGSGELTITNKRFFFYRTPPDSFKIMKEYGGYIHTMPDAISQMMEAKSAKKLGLKEFCQFDLFEIIKIIDFHKDFSYGDILSNKDRFRIILLKKWADIIKKELNRYLKKTESKGFIKKHNIYWYKEM